MNKLQLFIAGIICNTIFRFYPFCFQFGRPEENHTTYATGQALSFICFIVCAKELFITRVEKRVWNIGLTIAISNLLDELFFNPLQFEWNEKILIIFIIGNEVIRYYMNRNNNEQCTG